MYFWVEIAYKISLLQQVTCCLSLKKKTQIHAYRSMFEGSHVSGFRP
jgi:hypothetical protein